MSVGLVFFNVPLIALHNFGKAKFNRKSVPASVELKAGVK